MLTEEAALGSSRREPDDRRNPAGERATIFVEGWLARWVASCLGRSCARWPVSEGNEHGHAYLWPPDRKGAQPPPYRGAHCAYARNQPGQRSTVVGCLLQSLRRARGRSRRRANVHSRCVEGCLMGLQLEYGYREGNSDPSSLPFL